MPNVSMVGARSLRQFLSKHEDEAAMEVESGNKELRAGWRDLFGRFPVRSVKKVEVSNGQRD